MGSLLALAIINSFDILIGLAAIIGIYLLIKYLNKGIKK